MRDNIITIIVLCICAAALVAVVKAEAAVPVPVTKEKTTVCTIVYKVNPKTGNKGFKIVCPKPVKKPVLIPV